jgi:hypothetical protein
MIPIADRADVIGEGGSLCHGDLDPIAKSYKR